MKHERIITNKAQCRKCNTIIESRYTHDFVWCECGAIAVDGGKDYRKRVGELANCIELSEVQYVEVDIDSIGT